MQSPAVSKNTTATVVTVVTVVTVITMPPWVAASRPSE